MASPHEIYKYGEVEVNTRDLYEARTHAAAENGALDPRLGVSTKRVHCVTCGNFMEACNGHFGHVRLALPVFHIGYFRSIMATLQCICKSCSRLLLPENERREYLSKMRRAANDNLRRQQLFKIITDICKKVRRCPHCGSINGVVKKVGALKIVHEKYRYASKRGDLEETEHKLSFTYATEHLPELKQYTQRAADDLNPMRVYYLFQRMSATDCEALGMDPTKSRPELYIWRYVPAPPIAIRPSVAQDGATNEDDITIKLTEIVWTNSLIQAALSKGTPVGNLIEQWDFLQLSIAMYINSELPGVQNQHTTKPIRGFAQRLKGKQGRFRGNLSGKRVDFSGRTVISPDPNLSIEQVAIPEHVAKIMTYPERVTRYNRKHLQSLVLNGAYQYPGALFIYKTGDKHKKWLRNGDFKKYAEELKFGDVVERHLLDGDIVLFNRQPSLHKLSIMAFYVKVRPGRTFRLNECVCNPFNADFDGDEMNVHVPQTEEARAEAIQLMGVKHNLQTPRNGEPIIAAIQDFITVSYLITHKDVFYDRKSFSTICSYMFDAAVHIDLPSPCILKPIALWSGKQIFSILMRPSGKSQLLVNFEAKSRSFSPTPDMASDMCKNDGYVVVRNSEIMCGAFDKSIVGEGKKNSLFYVILRDYGSNEAAASMNRLAKLSARWVGNQGFSIGIGDVQPGHQLRQLKDSLVETAYSNCDDLIVQREAGTLENQAGCDQDQTLEAKISGILSRVRDDVGQICMKELGSTNAPLIMATCGSKGSKINVSQMVACVGQQIISGSRVPDGFQDRALPHFPKHSKQPPSKGFVRNSFYSGLLPTEFFFHAISGREGLVDTAVKTAETGYMSRRLMKSLEDLSSQYDASVRNASGGIVQFTYGNDGLDPTYLEGDGVPVDFRRTWTHCEQLSRNLQMRELLDVDGLLAAMASLKIDEKYTGTLSDSLFIESLEDFVKETVVQRFSKVSTAKRGRSSMGGNFSN